VEPRSLGAEGEGPAQRVGVGSERLQVDLHGVTNQAGLGGRGRKLGYEQPGQAGVSTLV